MFSCCTHLSPVYVLYCVEWDGMTRTTRKRLATRLPRGGRLQLLDTDNCYRILQWATITASSPADCRLPGPRYVSARHARPGHLLILLLDSTSARGQARASQQGDPRETFFYQKRGYAFFSKSSLLHLRKLNRY